MNVTSLRDRFDASALWYDGVYDAPAPGYLWHHEKNNSACDGRFGWSGRRWRGARARFSMWDAEAASWRAG